MLVWRICECVDVHKNFSEPFWVYSSAATSPVCHSSTFFLFSFFAFILTVSLFFPPLSFILGGQMLHFFFFFLALPDEGKRVDHALSFMIRKSDLFLSALHWEAESSGWRPCHSCKRWVDSFHPSRSLNWPKKKKNWWDASVCSWPLKTLTWCDSAPFGPRQPAHPGSSGHLLRSHLTLPITGFILPAVGAPKINSQLSLGNCINPHFSGGFFTRKKYAFVCRVRGVLRSFTRIPQYFSRRFFQGNFCFVFCEVCSCVRDDIIQTRRHGRAEFDGCGGSSCFYNCSIVIPCFVLIFIIVPTSQSLGSCHRSAPVYTVSCPERVQSWSRLVPVRAAAHTSVQICGIFPSNKQLSPTNEHML